MLMRTVESKGICSSSKSEHDMWSMSGLMNSAAVFAKKGSTGLCPC
jgi:hypothetical protein